MTPHDPPDPTHDGSAPGDQPGGGTRVLDVARIEEAAGLAVAGLRVDLGDVRARAARARRRLAVRATAVLAAACAVLLLALSVAVPALRTPEPAAPTDGPGALPATIHPAPTVPLLVTEHPIGAVAAVLATVRPLPSGLGGITATIPVLVSADGGAYRRLPAGQVGALVVSDDGRLVAWADTVSTDPADRLAGVLRWVDVRTGDDRSVVFDESSELLPAVESVLLAPDGRSALVGVSVLFDPEDTGARSHGLWSVDLTTSTARRVCGACGFGQAAYTPDGRLLAQDPTDVPPGLVSGELPRPPADAGSAAVLVAQPGLFATADGARLDVLEGTPSVGGDLDELRLGQTDLSGTTVREVPLGRWEAGTVLARSGDEAYVGVYGQGRTIVLRVDLAGRGVDEVMPSVDPQDAPFVVALAADVAATGRLVETEPPDGTPWWHLDRLRVAVPATVLLVVGVVAGLVLAPWGWVVLRRRVRRAWGQA